MCLILAATSVLVDTPGAEALTGTAKPITHNEVVMITLTVNYPSGSSEEIKFETIYIATEWLREHKGTWSSYMIVGTSL